MTARWRPPRRYDGPIGRAARKLLRRLDIDPRRGYRHSTVAVRQRLLTAAGTTLILDVGANEGQYAAALRNEGYPGRIVSFEPLPTAFPALAARAAADPRWECRQVALGERDGETTLYEAANSLSSSLLPMLDRHRTAAPHARVVREHRVRVTTIDRVAPEVATPADVIFLKADVQGGERQVLAGAAATLPRVALAELELSLVPLYDGAPSYLDVIEAMTAEGFRIVWLERAMIDRERDELLQVDALFRR